MRRSHLHAAHKRKRTAQGRPLVGHCPHSSALHQKRNGNRRKCSSGRGVLGVSVGAGVLVGW